MLYSSEMVALLQQLRARILAEFGVRIRLADPELLPSLVGFAKKSRDRMTVDAITRLLALAGLEAELSPPRMLAQNQAAAPTEVTYRGSKLSRTSTPGAAELDPAYTGAKSSSSRQVYRGQVVVK